jgi:hypothetical protein
LALAAVLLVVGWLAPPSLAQPAPETITLAKSLLEATRAAQNGDQMTARTMEMFSAALNEANPGRGPEIADLLNQVVAPELRAALPAMDDAMARAFAQNFSADELKQLVAFYRSDIGRKFVSRQPEIYRAQGEAGQALMARIGQKVIEAAEAHGLRRPQGF